jgi:hypothetical protein
MKIRLDLCDDDDGMVIVWTQEREAALRDQTILGARWEASGDPQGAYALLVNREGLTKDLKAEGYEVDAREWGPP